MSYHLFSLALFSAIFSTACQAVQAEPAKEQQEARKHSDRPADLLRAGKIKVDVLGPVLAPRALELTAKMQKAIQADPAYFLKAVQEAKPGEPLPYDQRSGLTKEEYAEYLKLIEERKVEKVADAEIEIKEPSPGVFVFNGGDDLGELTGIEIDLGRKEVRTRIGTAKKQEEYAIPATAPIGKCTGVEWSSEMETGTIRVSVSRQHATGKACIYFRIMSHSANPPAKVRRVICFETK